MRGVTRARARENGGGLGGQVCERALLYALEILPLAPLEEAELAVCGEGTDIGLKERMDYRLIEWQLLQRR
jgi:hypothetical protein